VAAGVAGGLPAGLANGSDGCGDEPEGAPEPLGGVGFRNGSWPGMSTTPGGGPPIVAGEVPPSAGAGRAPEGNVLDTKLFPPEGALFPAANGSEGT